MNEIDNIKQAAKAITQKQTAEGYISTGLYLYTDIEGSILYVRLRMDHLTKGKWIRPLSRDENGNWNQLKEPTFEDGKPIYNLHSIAKEPDKTVFIVEGEKCADSLRELGMLATTSGSSSSAKETNWQMLTNRDAIIWPDNDEAGKQYLYDVIARLKPLNIKIKVIEVSALNLPPKGDCVDWIAQFKEHNRRLPKDIDFQVLPLADNPLCVAEGGDIEEVHRTDEDIFDGLAKLSQAAYDRVRKEKAKSLKVQLKTLDEMVKQKRIENSQDDAPFQDVEVWDATVLLSDLLDELTVTIKRFIVLDENQAQACALWIVSSWFVNDIQCAPILLINAPEKACGKTQLLTVLAKLAPRSVQASSISPSVLFRMIEAFQPTLFVDEIETVLRDNEELRGLLNAGHTRDSAYVWRSVSKGDDFEPKQFAVWGMKAIAGINAIKLAETVTSRSIVIELRRKRNDETVVRLRRAEYGLFETLSSKLARVSNDYSNDIKLARPDLPSELGDRDQDNWEPLLQVANVAGGHWPITALSIAIIISNAIQAPLSSANELLSDIQEVFESKKVIRITTKELIEALCEDSERPWETYNRGKRLTPRQLSNKLKDYGISSKTIRFNPYETAKGFEAEQFKDAFSRYLKDPLNLPSQVTNPLQPAPMLGLGVNVTCNGKTEENQVRKNNDDVMEI